MTTFTCKYGHRKWHAQQLIDNGYWQHTDTKPNWTSNMFPLVADCRGWGCSLLAIYKWPHSQHSGIMPPGLALQPPANLQATSGVNIFVPDGKWIRENKHMIDEKTREEKKRKQRGDWYILVQSASWRHTNFTVFVKNNLLLILMILVFFWCFFFSLFTWFDLVSLRLILQKCTMRENCWLGY